MWLFMEPAEEGNGGRNAQGAFKSVPAALYASMGLFCLLRILLLKRDTGLSNDSPLFPFCMSAGTSQECCPVMASPGANALS